MNKKKEIKCDKCEKYIETIRKLLEENRFLTYCVKEESYFNSIKSHRANYREDKNIEDEE